MACGVCGECQWVPSPTPLRIACCRCTSRLKPRSKGSLGEVLAWSLTAGILLVPANILPVMTVTSLGRTQEHTIWSGVVDLFVGGDWAIASVVFIASIVIPWVKILALVMLVLTAGASHAGPFRSRVYRVLERIGKWSMLDVFLVALLIAMVKLGPLAEVIAGPGILAFGLAVVVTMVATKKFDPRLIWPPRQVPLTGGQGDA